MPSLRYSIDAGLLTLIMNCLQRDAEEGKISRQEILEEINKDVHPLEDTLNGKLEHSR